jgi:hypothetical protein
MNYQEKLNKDLEFGLKCENELLELFREKFDKFLCRTNQNAIVDYISPKTYLELKSRNCNHDRYDEIMIVKNKIEFAMKTKKKTYFVYNFLDGVYYYEFNYDDVEKGNITFKLGGRCDRGRDERKICGFIKSELLTKLE